MIHIYICTIGYRHTHTHTHNVSHILGRYNDITDVPHTRVRMCCLLRGWGVRL